MKHDIFLICIYFIFLFPLLVCAQTASNMLQSTGAMPSSAAAPAKTLGFKLVNLLSAICDLSSIALAILSQRKLHYMTNVYLRTAGIINSDIAGH